MFKYNFIYELKLLLRSKWIQLLSILLLVLFSFAAFNGQEKVEKRKLDITEMKQQIKDADDNMLKLLDSVERGMQVSVPRWTIPNSPMAVGNYYPRMASMDPSDFSFIATGQSDLYTHYVKPTVAGDDFALNFTEMTSPTQLLFGSFDLAFVIVYLLPLIIIAFSYNVLSYERESGSLKLLASQSISIKHWVLQKLGLRFFWLLIMVIATLTIVFFVIGKNPASDLVQYLSLLAIISTYMLFWFSIAFLVNILGNSSAKNAVSLLGLWVIFVLLVPSVLNQIGNTLYPMPSRTAMINKMRITKSDVTKRQDEILDNYLRDHPEYAINDSTQTRSFWHSYMASKELIKEELEPIVKTYDTQLRNQQQWLNKLKWMSPAITVQESLNKMAGTSTEDYENFRAQVVTFSESWREHFMPFLYNNKPFSQQDYSGLPTFQFEKKSHNVLMSTLIVLLISLGLLGLGVSISKTSNKILS